MSEDRSIESSSDVSSVVTGHRPMVSLRLPWILAALLIPTGILVILYPMMMWSPPSPLVDAGRRLFDLNGEANAPAWYSTILWFSASLLAWWLYRTMSSQRDLCARHWLYLAAIFLFMSLDESSMIHETIGALSDSLSMPGFFFYSWTIIWLAFVCSFFFIFLRFFLSLQQKIRLIFAMSALVFIAGSLGVEMVTAAAESQTLALPAGINWGMLIMLEEMLEMLGLVLLNMGLLTQTKMQGPICIRLV